MKTNVLQINHDREIAHAERFAFRKNGLSDITYGGAGTVGGIGR